MKSLIQFVPILFLCASLFAKETHTIEVNGQPVITYQVAPLSAPKGHRKFPPEHFQGSNFMHPLKTPSGFVVTALQPRDHLHHFGLWWPWKYLEVSGRKVNFWELQQGEGIVRARSHTADERGLVVMSEYLDRQHPDGPTILIIEKSNTSARAFAIGAADGYLLDLKISQRVLGAEPVVITQNRYSGFAFRATQYWNKKNSSILTSEGYDRDSANFTRARWVLTQGKTEQGADAGVLILSHPDNRAFPEKLRTWDKQYKGAVFINFNSVGDSAWTLLPDETYMRSYRLFIFDGQLTATQAESVWKAFAASGQ